MKPQETQPIVPNTQQKVEETVQPIIENVPVKKKFPYIWILISILSIILLSLLSYFVYTKYFVKDNLQNSENNNESEQGNNTNNNTNTNVENNVEPEDVTLSKDKLFYVKYSDKNNIYSYDLNAKTYVKLTNFTTELDVKGLNVFENNFLSYGVCNTVLNDYGCSIKYFDLNTLQETELLKLSSTQLLHNVDVYTKDKYVYLAMENKEGSQALQLIYVNSSKTQTLENMTVTDAYGRGGFEEDSEKVQFSPNGKYVLHISTSSPRSPMDFNTYVYNLEDGNKTKIINSTHPTWLNNTKIAFRQTQTSETGLYLYDLNTKLTEKLSGLSKNASDPRINQNGKLLLFTDYITQKVYLYDLDSKSITKVIDSASDTIWFNENTFVYQKTGKCINEEDCPMSSFKRLKLTVYNTSNDSSTDLTLDTIYLVASSLDNR